MNSTLSLARLAGRTALRNKLRSLLVVVLIALVVAVGTFVATIVRSTTATGEDYTVGLYGGSDFVIDVGTHGIAPSGRFEVPIDDEPAQQAVADLDADQVAAALASEYDAMVQRSRMWVPDRFGYVDPFRRSRPTPRLLVDLDVTHPLSQGVYRLVAGRAPEAPTEIAMTPSLMNDEDYALGADVELWGAEFTIVGEFAKAAQGFSSAVVTPGGFDRAVGDGGEIVHRFRLSRDAQSTLGSVTTADVRAIVGGPDMITVHDRTSRRDPVGAPFENSGGFAPLMSTTVSVALGIQMALIAASAFAVGVRRRTVEFGQLMTAGASASHVRLLVLIEAAVLGTLGAVLGVGTGAAVGAWAIGNGNLADLSSRYATDFRWHVVDLIGPAAIGIVAAIVAAWWPARAISSLSPTSALAGRVPVKAPRRSLPVVGVVLAAAGTFGTVAFARMMTNGNNMASDEAVTVVLLLLSMMSMFGGFLLLIGSVLATGARWADRLPMRARIVVRNSDRHRSRSWASVAAFVAALAMPILIASSAQAYPGSWAQSGKQIVLTLPIELEDDLVAARTEHFVDSFETQLAELAPLDASAELRGPRRSDYAVGFTQRGSASGQDLSLGMITIATPELGAALGLSDVDLSRLDANTALVMGRRSPAILDVYDVRATGPTTPVASFEMVSVGSDPGTFNNIGALVSEAGANRIASEIDEIGRLFVTGEAISRRVADDVRDVAGDAWDGALAVHPPGDRDRPVAGGLPSNDRLPALSVGPTTDGPTGPQIRTIAIALATALAALVALIGAALAAVEMQRDLGAMIATGAAPSIRRWLLGLQTSYHLFIAAVLAIPIAVLLFWATTRADANGPLGLTFPWTTMAIVGLAVPLLVGLAVACIFRSGGPSVSRRLS